MRPHERLSYSPISQRPRLVLPGGARMVVWVIVNVEEWDIDQPMPRTVLTPPAGGQPSPDIPNWAWHEYGNRVGFWRMLEVFDQFRIPGVLAVNGSCLQSYPQIAQAALAGASSVRSETALCAPAPRGAGQWHDATARIRAHRSAPDPRGLGKGGSAGFQGLPLAGLRCFGGGVTLGHNLPSLHRPRDAWAPLEKARPDPARRWQILIA